jgi:hypothetical protein
MEEDSGDDSREGTIKFSRFSSKLKVDLPNEVHLVMRSLVIDIVNKSLEIVLPEKEDSEEEDSDDEYFKQIGQRMKKFEESNNNNRRDTKLQSITNNTFSNSKFANKFLETTKVRIYLLNTQNYVDISIGLNDTAKDLKIKVLLYLQKEGSKCKLRYTQVEAYELRLAEDDDDDDILPNMEFAPFDDKLNILKSKNDTMAFVEKINFNPETDTSYITTSILGTTTKDSEIVKLI